MKKIVFICLLLVGSFFHLFAFELKDGVFCDFSVGPAFSYNTRVVDQAKYNRTNFVFVDTSPGLSVGFYLGQAKKWISLAARVTLYYPLGYTFNSVPMKYSNMFNLMADVTLGPSIDIQLFKFLGFGILPVIHYNFFWEDRYLYNTIGAGIGLEFRVPVYKRQQVVLGYFFTYDFLDLGSNARTEPLKARFMHEVGLTYRF